MSLSVFVSTIYISTRGWEEDPSPKYVNPERLEVYYPEKQDHPDVDDYYKFKEKGNEIKFERLYKERLEKLEKERIKREKKEERKRKEERQRKEEEQKRIEEQELKEQKEREQEEKQEKILAEKESESNKSRSSEEDSEQSNKSKSETKEDVESSQSETDNVEESNDWQTFEITAYTNDAESTDKNPGDSGYGLTASGNQTQSGTTIACPPNMNFGTKVHIPDMNNTYTCQDRGADIVEGRLDIYMPNLDDARSFGRRNMKVQIKE